MIQINDKCMSLTLGGEIFATARFSQYAAADDNGAWIVCTHPRPAVLPQPGDHGSDARRTPRRWLWPEPWPGRCPSHRLAALALVGSFELLMLLIGTHQRASSDHVTPNHSGIAGGFDEPPAAPTVPSLERAVRTGHAEGRSQRSIARDLNINHRRMVKQIIDCDAA